MNGKINCHGVATLPSGGGDMTVTDPRASTGKRDITGALLTLIFTTMSRISKQRTTGLLSLGSKVTVTATDIEYVIIG